MSEGIDRIRIAHMWGEITGIVTAFEQIPRKLQDAELPAVVIFPGRATHSKTDFGETIIHEVRIYKMALYICNAHFGSQGQTEIQADPFFDQVLQHFAARPGLELDSQGVNQSESEFDTDLLSDSGLQVGPYPIDTATDAHQYIQITWDLQVEGLIDIAYKD